VSSLSANGARRRPTTPSRSSSASVKSPTITARDPPPSRVERGLTGRTSDVQRAQLSATSRCPEFDTRDALHRRRSHEAKTGRRFPADDRRRLCTAVSSSGVVDTGPGMSMASHNTASVKIVTDGTHIYHPVLFKPPPANGAVMDVNNTGAGGHRSRRRANGSLSGVSCRAPVPHAPSDVPRWRSALFPGRPPTTPEIRDAGWSTRQ